MKNYNTEKEKIKEELKRIEDKVEKGIWRRTRRKNEDTEKEEKGAEQEEE